MTHYNNCVLTQYAFGFFDPFFPVLFHFFITMSAQREHFAVKR